MMDKTTKTQTYYDGIAQGYAQLYHEEQQEKINLVKEYLPQEGRILDCGSGDGVLNEFVQNTISLDLSFELLKLNSNSRKVQGSITQLPFKNGMFDTICCFTVIQDVENVEKGIREMVRVLKEQGTLIISFLQVSTKKERIEKELKDYFEILTEIDEKKDKIMVLKKITSSS